ncbi:MAG: DUF1015 family protein [Gemmatimonadales bacterium]|nr:DUF1015 domain-containing protein [Gemmatimonadota bacterium]MDX2058886.1 DUF1015 family protein [Gemmatimonadales bacterium]
MRLKPFRAWRPDPAIAARVAAPPYDVVNRTEAAELAHGNPFSFLHVGRSDIDLPADVDPYDERIYLKARDNLKAFMRDGTLIQDRDPSLYLYELTMDGRAQVGVVGCVHVDDYELDVIKKHERTRKDKEDDRTRHVLVTNSNAEPVFLTYEGQPYLDRLAADTMRTPPLYDFTSADRVRHRVWAVRNADPYLDAFRRIPVAYVADGHHRSASAWRAGMERKSRNSSHSGLEEYNWFLAVLFPANQLQILPYNRVVKDLNGLTPDEFLSRLRALGSLTPTASPAPERSGVFGVYLAGQWYRLELHPESINALDPIKSLDAELLYDRILAPILGIGDIRADKRIDFVGGIRGRADLEKRVSSGEMAVAFMLYPVRIEQVMAVADGGGIMPPKTTWFEPKLKSGLFVHTLD